MLSWHVPVSAQTVWPSCLFAHLWTGSTMDMPAIPTASAWWWLTCRLENFLARISWSQAHLAIYWDVPTLRCRLEPRATSPVLIDSGTEPLGAWAGLLSCWAHPMSWVSSQLSDIQSFKEFWSWNIISVRNDGKSFRNDPLLNSKSLCCGSRWKSGNPLELWWICWDLNGPWKWRWQFCTSFGPRPFLRVGDIVSQSSDQVWTIVLKLCTYVIPVASIFQLLV